MYPGTRKNFEFGTTVAAELLALKFLSPLGNWRGDSELKKTEKVICRPRKQLMQNMSIRLRNKLTHLKTEDPSNKN